MHDCARVLHCNAPWLEEGEGHSCNLIHGLMQKCFWLYACRREAIGYFAVSAQQLAERMAQRREKEVVARDRFQAHVERYLPRSLLLSLGLFIAPPHCQISITAQAPLPEIRLEDIHRIPEDTAVSVHVQLASTAFESGENGFCRSTGQPGKSRALTLTHPVSSLQAASAAIPEPFQEQAGSPDAPPEDALAASEHPGAASQAAHGDALVADLQSMEVDLAKARAELAAYKVLEASRIDDPYAASGSPGLPGAGPVAAALATAASPAAHRQAALQAAAMVASIGDCSAEFQTCLLGFR